MDLTPSLQDTWTHMHILTQTQIQWFLFLSITCKEIATLIDGKFSNPVFSLPTLFDLALCWPWHFPPANRIYDDVILNKHAWHKAFSYAWPAFPRYRLCLLYFLSSLFLIPSLPTRHLTVQDPSSWWLRRACVWVPLGYMPRRRHMTPRAGVGVSHQYVCWELDLGSLEEQEVPLIIEPSL